MTRIFTLTLFFAAASVGLLSAQTTLSGKVTNGQNKPVEYATVMLLNASDSSLVKGAISDTAGVYTLPQIKEGSYLLSASMMGYEKAWAGPLAVKASGSQSLPRLELQEAIEQLKAVTVVGQRPMVVQEADRMILNVEGSILATGGTALEVLEKAPGVTVDQDGNISLNGKQGIIVMIDGKRTYLSNADIANMLRNMPSDALEQVELITNPSAKYDAAGNSGIINIKTKKGKNDGTNGSLSLGAGYGRFEKARGGLTLNHRQGITNFFGSYNYSRGRSFQELRLDRSVLVDGDPTRYQQSSYMPTNSQNHTIKAGVDLFLNKKNTLGVMVNSSNSLWGSTINNDALLSIGGVADTDIIMRGNMEEKYSNTTANLNYQRTFDQAGKELSVDVDYTRYRGDQDNLFNNRFSYYHGQEDSLFMLRNIAPSNIDIWVAKIDYSLPLGKSKLDLGAKSSFVVSDNLAKIEKRENEESWVIWDELTNDFLYTENINAAFANWSGSLGKFKLMAGLRAEHTWYEGESVKNDSTAKNQYVSLFPSMFVQRPLSEKHTMGFSYSRRVDRPSYQDLNPFFYLLDVNTYAKGNPLLQPQFTHQVQLNHTFNQAIVTSFTYSVTDGPMTEILDNDGITAFQTRANLGTLTNWNVNVAVPVPVTKWWTMQNNLSVYQNKFTGTFNEQLLDRKQLTANVYMMNSFKLPYNFSAELSGWYRSPQVWGIINMQSMYALNAGVQYRFWDSNASLKLSANDILRTQVFKASSNFNGLALDINNRWESRRLNLAFSYRFGNNDVKPANRKRGASSDEQGRIKTGQN
jgi:hypothetical protein